MQLCAAIVHIKQIRLALVQVDPEQTYPAPAEALLEQIQSAFPFPIVLVSPRIQGFSRTFAHFQVDKLLPHINTDEISWATFDLTRPHWLVGPEPDLPF